MKLGIIARSKGRCDCKRLLSKMIPIMAVMGSWSYLFVHLTMAQNHAAASELVQKLRSDETTDEARKQLLQLGQSEPDVRRYLATQLPPLIEIGPKSCASSKIVDLVARWHACPWYNAVELSGNLKIGEAAPALARWISWRSEGPYGLSLEARLVFHPAAKALAQIGDPAIPAVQHALDHGNADEHYKAVRVLCIIHSANAKAVLRGDLPHETDPALQTMIKNDLRE
jgi:hypothetical protein